MNQEIDFFNSLADRWDTIRSSDNNKIEKLIGMSGLVPGDTVLDAGCGTGILLPFIKKMIGDNGHITAVDFSQNMINRAAQNNCTLTGISYIVSDIMDFQSKPIFNKITCLNFFPHIVEKTLFLKRMKNILQPKGSLIIMHDISRAEVNAIHRSSEVVTNDRLPKAADLVDMMVSTGYEAQICMETDSFYYVKANI